MEHTVLYKKEGHYAAFPGLMHLPDGRLSVGIPVSPFHDHFLVGDWIVLVSEDEGQSWSKTTDLTIPHTWPGISQREKYDRLATVLPDGSYLCAGSVGWEEWNKNQEDKAESRGLIVYPHPSDPDMIIVGSHRLFVQRSTDKGNTWLRREWEVPGIHHITTFPRHAVLADGTLLLTVYGSTPEARRCNYVLRSTDQGETWRFIHMNAPESAEGSESAFLEVAPGRILAHTRNEAGTLLERWSDDGGQTWTHPLLSSVLGYPPHLLMLNDGRILCSYGYRRDPMGVRAVISEDGGQTWSDPIILRDDGGTPSSLRPDVPTGGADLGYPVSTQLFDDSILTV